MMAAEMTYMSVMAAEMEYVSAMMPAGSVMPP